MILQKNAPPASRHSKDTTHARKENEEIVFNSGDLSLDYQVNMDTLLKKNDGFSAMNMYNVQIEGNNYKLFLYPFPFHGQRTIMAGLVSISNYTSRYESAPISLITTASILLLLLVVAIPLLKIYIIGSHERITTFDLRMIIGTYFIGGLILFFLFAWNFLGSVQSAKNKLALRHSRHSSKQISAARSIQPAGNSEHTIIFIIIMAAFIPCCRKNIRIQPK